MEESAGNPRNRSNPFLGVKSYGHQGPRGERHRVAWLWVHHLYSQIWRGSPCRIDLLSSPLHSDDATCGHVLDGDRNRNHHEYWDRWFQAGWGLVSFFLAVAAALVTGCSQPDWQTRYSSALTEFRNGNSDAALTLIADLPASPGAHPTLWYWRARVLRAQIFLRQYQPAQALGFLSSFPAKLPDEIMVKRNVFAGVALCETGKAEDALKRFADAERIISTTTPSLRADLLYARADCASDDHPEEAMQLFTQSASLAHGNDSYLEGRALAYHGYLLMQSKYYDKAIELFDRALIITESPYLKQTLLGNKGVSTGELGERITSGIYLKQAVETASHIKDAKADHALWLVNLGHQQVSQMEYADAEQSFRKGSEIAKGTRRSDLVGLCLINSA